MPVSMLGAAAAEIGVSQFLGRGEHREESQGWWEGRPGVRAVGIRKETACFGGRQWDISGSEQSV